MSPLNDWSWHDWEGYLPALLVGVGLVLIAGLVIARLRRMRRSREIDHEAGLAEFLAQYPQPPEIGLTRLRFEGQPVRVRLIVLAPSGRGGDLQASMVQSILEAVLFRLGDTACRDLPRIRIWPPQLSQHGFAPAFFRRTKRPEPKDQPSRWILVAGPARVGPNMVLLGMALEAREPTLRGSVVMKVDSWPDRFRVQETS